MAWIPPAGLWDPAARQVLVFHGYFFAEQRVPVMDGERCGRGEPAPSYGPAARAGH